MGSLLPLAPSLDTLNYKNQAPGAGREAQGVRVLVAKRDNLSEFSLQNPKGARKTNS